MKSFKMILSIIAISIGLSYISSSSAADALPLTLVSQTNTTITLGWTPQAGYGYLFFNKCDANLENCTLVSRTNDPNRNTVKFAKGNNYYKVSVIVEGNSGGYPPVAPPPPPPPDTTPPTNPSGLNVTNVTDTSLTFNWSASTDNVAVTGYDVFRNSVKVATTTLLNNPMSGLNCATTYILGVQAFDAAGNKSSVVNINATTSACPPPPSGANYYISPTGSDSNACTQTSPCASLDRAYNVAAFGNTVQIASGNYPQQIITDAPGKETTGDAPDIVFQPAPGAIVKFAGLRLGTDIENNLAPDHITIKNINSSCACDVFIGGNDANDITIENLNGFTNFYINGAQNTTIKGGTYGPSETPSTGNSKVDGNITNSNIVIDGVTFRDYTFGPTCQAYGGPVDCHFEALFLAGTGPGFVLRNSKFWHNEIYDVFIQPNTAASGIIENNWFGRAENPPSTLRNGAVVIGGPVSNWLIRYNSFAPGQGIVDECGASCISNVRAIGNIFGISASGNCAGNISYSYNIWTSGTCNATDKSINPLPYVNTSDLSAMDYHLKDTTNLANNLVTVNTSDANLLTDFDGEARNSPRDAGSDEVNAAPPPPPPPTGYVGNVYLSSTQGSPGCIRSATKVDYQTAQANGNVCNTWQTACNVATGGDEVGVKTTSIMTPFPETTPGAAATYIDGDCSKGLGNDIDPTILPVGTNPTDVISNWVTFECADGPARDSVIMDVKYFTPNGNNHMYVNGSCFLFGTIEGGMGGASGLTTQNFIFDGVHLQGFQINGARNVWLRNIELGPVVLCYQDGSGVPESQQCDSSGSLIGYLEHRWANRSGGSSDLQTQGRVNPNRDTHSQNVLVENVWWHDSQSKESVALHSGCGFVLDNQSADTNNVIYRDVLCERVVHQGMYVSDSSGVTMENWQIGCPVEPLDNVGEANWGVTNCNQRAFHINCAIACSNLLYRFNSSLSAVDLINNTEVGINVRVVANIANTFNCPSDVAGGYNVRSGAGVGCGTNNTTYSTSPFVDTNQSPTPTSSPSIDMHLSGSPGSFPFENTVTPNTGDYDLSKDMDLETRSGDPGADSR